MEPGDKSEGQFMRTWDRLSATFVRGLKRPGRFYDGGGLLLEVSPSATGGVNKSWLFRYQLHHVERVMGLGALRVVTLAEARAKANAARKLLAAGIDPLAQRKHDRAEARAAELRNAIFRECLDGFLMSHGDRWRAKHLAQWRNSMATYCKPLMGVAVADIDTGMVLQVIEPQWKRAPQTMDRVRRRIGEVLGYAQVRGLRPPGPLPTLWKNHLDKMLAAVRDLAPVQHHPALPYAEVPALYQRLIATDGIPELALGFAMLTATRSQEARGARWDEIDLKAKVWIVPPSRMKRKREHRVPLSSEALALIARLPRNGEHLFCVNGNGRPVVAMSLRKALRRHGAVGVSVHGLRSSYRDWGGERTNAPRELLEVSLSHAIGDATEAAYARGDLLEKRRRLMQQWATFLAAPPADTARVVPLRGGRRHGR
jgi:integrase